MKTWMMAALRNWHQLPREKQLMACLWKGLLVLNKQKIKSYWGSLKSLQYLLVHTLCEFKVIWFRNIKAYFTWIAFLKWACYIKLKGIFIQTILTNFPIAWLVRHSSLLLPTGLRAAERHGAQHHFISLSFLFPFSFLPTYMEAKHCAR